MQNEHVYVVIGSETATSVQTDSSFYIADMAITGPEEIAEIQRAEAFLDLIETNHRGQLLQ